MSDKTISALLSLSLISSPIALSSSAPSPSSLPEASFPISTGRSSLRKLKNFLTEAPKLQPMGVYVGELQEKWKFPSDHLPIGMTFEDLNFASWNVLDSDYISWVTEKNSQGLSRSMIADEHVYIEGTALTIRDRHTVGLILEMLTHPTHPKQILSLQECNDAFLEELNKRLPSNFAALSHEGNTILIDTNRFEVVRSGSVAGIFSDSPTRTVQDVILKRKDTAEKLRLVNVHLPGDPDKPGRFEFAQYLAKTFDRDLSTIAMGDMNFNELEMDDAVKKAFSSSSPFSVYSPYCTNISPFTFHSKVIDHFIVYPRKEQSEVTVHAPEETMTGLGTIVDLLH